MNRILDPPEPPKLNQGIKSLNMFISNTKTEVLLSIFSTEQKAQRY